MAGASGAAAPGFTPEAVERIGQHSFPGNVRELNNLVERLVFTAPPGPIGVGSVREVLPSQVPARAPTGRLSDAVQEFERKEIETALREARGNMTQAAARLGLERSHLYKKMKKLGMSPEPSSGAGKPER